MTDPKQDGWTRQPAAAPAELAELMRDSPVPLPTAYLELLSASNGGSGDLGRQPGWFVLWRAREVISQNEGYEVQRHLQGFMAFGTNGGGELLAFDTRRGQPYAVVAVPFIPMQAEDALRIADSFEEFCTLMGHEWTEG
jgi:hypothetical protein